jgi:hypothetical protein
VKLIRVTSPMTTPRYFIFDPMSSPCTDSLKYVSITARGFSQRPVPMISSTATPAATAPMTNSPSLK